MTASEQKTSPDFFEDHDLDPLAAATGDKIKRPPVRKKKAGFYLSEQLLERFNRMFHQMKLDGVAIENKSALVEIALGFALDDLDRGEKSRIGAALK
jgi:ribonuclease I